MKYKTLGILFGLVILALGSGITYSAFYSGSSVQADQKLAKFVFDSQKLDHLELSLVDLKPGDIEDYTFSVSNNDNSSKTDVTINYQITVRTFHFIPLNIELYKNNVLVMNCNEEHYTRNEFNELVCNSPLQEMPYSGELNDAYILKVTFPKEYNSVEYADLVDYIDLDIKSFQKLD